MDSSASSARKACIPGVECALRSQKASVTICPGWGGGGARSGGGGGVRRTQTRGTHAGSRLPTAQSHGGQPRA